MGRRQCVCGHDEAAHRHYRDGSDCALCGDGACARFRPASGLCGLFAKLTGR
ncbi:MAG: hypothetical protein QM809_07165 [Gordonia sp. (in: high G+C Gram-positive bacteria)]|uniref:hypothetical protein n=1 Tax=Gordonia sp. (in: high G+C Gram-positive bacteria) TaxID=84139 RepID=UPI0039E33263